MEKKSKIYLTFIQSIKKLDNVIMIIIHSNNYVIFGIISILNVKIIYQ